ncbi:MAG: hypothetical protein H8D45_27995 [Bacteroidetes bacterium]|nr:hypothetical protein [Bacteroidota bacterium]MBL7104282.1 hypothetical protein [Bacteroidales bacterium]
MKKRIEKSKGFDEEKRLEEDAFLKLSDDERFRVACELSEIMLQIQYENGVLPKDVNFTLTK